MPRQLSYSYDTRTILSPARETQSSQDTGGHYTDFDYKVISYMGQLAREDTVKSSVTRSRYERYLFAAVIYLCPVASLNLNMREKHGALFL